MKRELSELISKHIQSPSVAIPAARLRSLQKLFISGEYKNVCLLEESASPPSREQQSNDSLSLRKQGKILEVYDGGYFPGVIDEKDISEIISSLQPGESSKNPELIQKIQSKCIKIPHENDKSTWSALGMETKIITDINKITPEDIEKIRRIRENAENFKSVYECTLSREIELLEKLDQEINELKTALPKQAARSPYLQQCRAALEQAENSNLNNPVRKIALKKARFFFDIYSVQECLKKTSSSPYLTHCRKAFNEAETFAITSTTEMAPAKEQAFKKAIHFFNADSIYQQLAAIKLKFEEDNYYFQDAETILKQVLDEKTTNIEDAVKKANIRLNYLNTPACTSTDTDAKLTPLQRWKKLEKNYHASHSAVSGLPPYISHKERQKFLNLEEIEDQEKFVATKEQWVKERNAIENDWMALPRKKTQQPAFNTELFLQKLNPDHSDLLMARNQLTEETERQAAESDREIKLEQAKLRDAISEIKKTAANKQLDDINQIINTLNNQLAPQALVSLQKAQHRLIVLIETIEAKDAEQVLNSAIPDNLEEKQTHIKLLQNKTNSIKAQLKSVEDTLLSSIRKIHQEIFDVETVDVPEDKSNPSPQKITLIPSIFLMKILLEVAQSRKKAHEPDSILETVTTILQDKAIKKDKERDKEIIEEIEKKLTENNGITEIKIKKLSELIDQLSTSEQQFSSTAKTIITQLNKQGPYDSGLARTPKPVKTSYSDIRARSFAEFNLKSKRKKEKTLIKKMIFEQRIKSSASNGSNSSSPKEEEIKSYSPSPRSDLSASCTPTSRSESGAKRDFSFTIPSTPEKTLSEIGILTPSSSVSESGDDYDSDFELKTAKNSPVKSSSDTTNEIKEYNQIRQHATSFFEKLTEGGDYYLDNKEIHGEIDDKISEKTYEFNGRHDKTISNLNNFFFEENQLNLIKKELTELIIFIAGYHFDNRNNRLNFYADEEIKVKTAIMNIYNNIEKYGRDKVISGLDVIKCAFFSCDAIKAKIENLKEQVKIQRVPQYIKAEIKKVENSKKSKIHFSSVINFFSTSPSKVKLINLLKEIKEKINNIHNLRKEIGILSLDTAPTLISSGYKRLSPNYRNRGKHISKNYLQQELDAVKFFLQNFKNSDFKDDKEINENIIFILKYAFDKIHSIKSIVDSALKSDLSPGKFREEYQDAFFSYDQEMMIIRTLLPYYQDNKKTFLQTQIKYFKQQLDLNLLDPTSINEIEPSNLFEKLYNKRMQHVAAIADSLQYLNCSI